MWSENIIWMCEQNTYRKRTRLELSSSLEVTDNPCFCCEEISWESSKSARLFDNSVKFLEVGQ